MGRWKRAAQIFLPFKIHLLFVFGDVLRVIGEVFHEVLFKVS